MIDLRVKEDKGFERIKQDNRDLFSILKMRLKWIVMVDACTGKMKTWEIAI